MSIKVKTFGCRLNIYESEVIKSFLRENKKLEDKDIIIFNSCTVTSEAEKQLKQAIRREGKENPNFIIGVVGCAIQTNREAYKVMEEVDFILGNIDKMKKDNYNFLINYKKSFKEKIIPSKKPAIVTNIFNTTELSSYFINGFEEKTRGFVQIQSGCDNHCTFCATRLARGNSVSIPSNKIIDQINNLVKNGYNEIVLTGIDITDYGKKLEENINLGKLMNKILKQTELKRLRLSSIDISGVNDDLKELLFNEKRVMPHIHISLQSGDNTILKRMARRHNREQVIDFCNEIKKYRKNIAIGADLIAGFPTENEDMHKNSCKLIEEIELVFGHIFPYSIRENTPAAFMKQVPVEIRRQRARELREIATKQLERFKKEQMEFKHKVLIETEKIGRTENYLSVDLPPNFLDRYKIGNVVEISFVNGHAT